MVASFFKLCSKGDQLKSNWPSSNFPKLETDPSFYYLGGLVIGGRDWRYLDGIYHINHILIILSVIVSCCILSQRSRKNSTKDCCAASQLGPGAMPAKF